MEKDYYYRDDKHHYDVPNIDRFSHFYLATKQNKEESHYAKLDLNLKKSPKCKSFELIKQNRKISILLVVIVILALVVVAVACKKINHLKYIFRLLESQFVIHRWFINIKSLLTLVLR
jgi:hypothetical protein